jgi:CheY-like chemotaxis protein
MKPPSLLRRFFKKAFYSDHHTMDWRRDMPDNEAPSAQGKQTAMKTILIIEDEAVVGELIVQLIAQETPHRAILAADSSRAFNILEHIKPDLFLLDYHLPRMNGIELYDRLHATEGLENIPAILMTAGVLEHNFHRRKVVGISKPFALNKLLDLIEELLACDDAEDAPDVG